MEFDAETAGPHRVRELWFKDGNLILEAGNSQYRVYGGFLGARSHVFADMLEIPQPPDSELVEGCPLVRIPDPDVEVTPFSKAMFEPEYFMPYPAHTTFDAIVGCLRLSHKYGVDYLRQRALVHFSSGYHTKLHMLDAYMEDRDDGECPSWLVRNNPILTIRAIQLAREVDAVWILPKAFYNLANDFDQAGTAAILNGSLYNGVQCRLSVQDQISFLDGHLVQRRTTAAEALRFLSEPLNIDGCDEPPECHYGRLIGVQHGRGFLNLFPSSFLILWDEEDWDLLEDVCPTCLATLRKVRQDAREAFWERLPAIYNLPPWEELEQMKVAAIGTSQAV
ncbi:hypothetical protein DFH06DRAFT_1027061 [Mycena polygramma]|nr:hypothetical protein DFH06DRAFT_1027061 [Mycena polygramma]